MLSSGSAFAQQPFTPATPGVDAQPGVSGTGGAQTRPAEAAVSEGDYRLDSGDWNGMKDLYLLAQGQQIELIPHTTLDFDAVKLDEPLLIVYPLRRMDVGSLSRYVIAGGRVLIADDFGQSEPLLRRLDLQRVTPARGGLPHDEYLQENPSLPILRPAGVHPLLEGVETVVANHPSVLINVGGPVVAYSQGGGLVYDMNLGKGKVVVMADASVLINHMITVGDNDQLVRNMLNYLCKNEAKPGEDIALRKPCRAHLYIGDVPGAGRYGRDDLRSWMDLRDDALQDADAFNEALRDFMEQLPTDRLFYYLGLLLSLGLVVYLFTIFPARPTRRHSTYIADRHQPGVQPQSEFDWNMARYAGGGSGMNYELPAALLKELFEEILLTELGQWPRDEDAKPLDPSDTARAFARDLLSEHPADMVSRQERELSEVLRAFQRIPTRARVGLNSEVYVSARDLVKLHERCLELLDVMGRKDEYERRTRSIL